jgi:hypothetical protein
MSVFSWNKKQVPTASDEFRASLPKSPLVEHLTSLHVMVKMLDRGDDPNLIAMAEQHLREIAVFVADRYHPHSALPEAKTLKPVANPVRVVRIREGKNKR